MLKKLLAAFSPRTLGNVPNKAGFCFPYGFFISDSGKERYQIKNSFRFTDQPNIVYTLNTGINRYYLLSQSASLGLTIRVPKFIPPEKFNHVVTINQTISLKNGNSLHLKGWQASQKEPNHDNQQPINHYIAYGEFILKQPNNHDLFITVQIRSYPADKQNNRPNEAPTFDIAVARLMPILESLAVTLDH